MNFNSTEQLASLVRQKETCLTRLLELGVRQCQFIADGAMTNLLRLLAVKQSVIVELQQLERQLDPYRDQQADQRQWRSSEERHECARAIERCERLFADVLAQEKHGEDRLRARRDAAAAELSGAHLAHQAQSAYLSADTPLVGALDLASGE